MEFFSNSVDKKNIFRNNLFTGAAVGPGDPRTADWYQTEKDRLQ